MSICIYSHQLSVSDEDKIINEVKVIKSEITMLLMIQVFGYLTICIRSATTPAKA